MRRGQHAHHGREHTDLGLYADSTRSMGGLCVVATDWNPHKTDNDETDVVMSQQTLLTVFLSASLHELDDD